MAETEVNGPLLIPRGDDLAVAVRRLEIDGIELVDVREFVPSTEVYGRGITLPAALAKSLASVLRTV